MPAVRNRTILIDRKLRQLIKDVGVLLNEVVIALTVSGVQVAENDVVERDHLWGVDAALIE